MEEVSLKRSHKSNLTKTIRNFLFCHTNFVTASLCGIKMSEEKKKIPDDLKKELLEKTGESSSDVDEVAAKLEGKIPTKPKDEEE